MDFFTYFTRVSGMEERPDVVKSFGLGLVRRGYFEGYDPRVNPAVANAFATAAFRFGHSLVQNSLLRCDRSHRPLPANFSLHEELTKPAYLHHVGSVDELLLGMCAQPAQKRDEFITEQLTNHLFQTSHLQWGMDLAAINIQRGRDHGLAPYNTWREACGLQPFTNWVQMLKVMSPETQRKFKKIYRDIDDVDLFPGAMSEKPVSGGLVGPTFACILAQQFSNLRRGDRFWYENGGFESSFTPAQLHQLRKITLARILCDNLDSIDTIQPFVFLASDNDRNKYMPCEKIPNFDLTPWTEHRIVNEDDSHHHGNYNDQENHYGESSTTKHPPYHSQHDHDSYLTTQEHHYHKPTESHHYHKPTESHHYHKPTESHHYYEHTTETHHHSHYQQPIQPPENHYHKPIINDYQKPILLPPEQDHYGSHSSSKPTYKPKPQNNYSISYIYEFDLEHKPKPTPTPTYSKPKPSINPTPSYTVIHVHHSVEHHPSTGHSDSYHSPVHSKPGYQPPDHPKPLHHGDSYLPNHSHGQKGDTYTSQSDSYLPSKPHNTFRPIKTTTQKPVIKPYYPTEDSDRPPSIDNYGPDVFPSDSHKPPADPYRPIKPNVQDYGYYKPVTDGYKPPDTSAYKPPHIYGSLSYSNNYRPTKPTTAGLNKPTYGSSNPYYENHGTPKPTIDKYGPPKLDQNYYKPSQYETSTVTYPKPEIIYSDPKPSMNENHHSTNPIMQQYPKPIRPLKGSSQYTVIEVQHEYSSSDECKDPSHIKPSSIVNADSAHDSYHPPSQNHGNHGNFANSHSKPFIYHSHNSKPKPPSNLESEDTPLIIFTSVSTKSSGAHRLKGNQKNSSSEATNSSRFNVYNSETNDENIKHDFSKYVSLKTSPELPTPGLGAEARNTAQMGADNSDRWTFDAKEVDDSEEIPEVLYLPSDPESVRELPHPIIEENDEFSGEDDDDDDDDDDELDSRSLW
ncbi:Peroxidasin [Gryllus bimaculatus]|nr:Peroxidasin [Gryllus bimaculatus]